MAEPNWKEQLAIILTDEAKVGEVHKGVDHFGFP